MNIQIGDVVGRLQIIREAGFRTYKSGVRRRVFLCRCQCGRTVKVVGSLLQAHAVKSCGCLRSDHARQLNFSHGDAGSKLYMVWVEIRRRCENPTRASWKYYGQRGITICKAWRNSWSAFKKWALAAGYRPGLTIGRIDNDKGYCPSNCRWETTQDQNNNQRRTHWITFADGHRESLANAVRHHSSVGYNTVFSRIRHGWDPLLAVLAPWKTRRNK